jgi:hydrogenase nickel incorporation protein HypA/HybF
MTVRSLLTAHRLLLMHELSIALSMIEMAGEELRENGGTKVDAVHLKLGRLSGVVEDALLFSWEVACAGTSLEGSRLIIEDVPIVVRCENCREDKTLAAINRLVCPVCENPTPEILQGRELLVTALEIV